MYINLRQQCFIVILIPNFCNACSFILHHRSFTVYILFFDCFPKNAKEKCINSQFITPPQMVIMRRNSGCSLESEITCLVSRPWQVDVLTRRPPLINCGRPSIIFARLSNRLDSRKHGRGPVVAYIPRKGQFSETKLVTSVTSKYEPLTRCSIFQQMNADEKQ